MIILVLYSLTNASMEWTNLISNCVTRVIDLPRRPEKKLIKTCDFGEVADTMLELSTNIK